MTLTYALGLVSGSRDQLSLPITVWDDAYATLDRDAALAYCESVAPIEVLDCKVTSDISISEESRAIIKFAVTYKRTTNITLRHASITAKSKKLYHFLSAGKVYEGTGTDVSSTNLRLKYKLDRQGAGAEFNNGKPLSVDPYTETRSFDILTSQDMISDKFMDAMEELFGEGKFNAAECWGKDAKSLQAVKFTATERGYNDWEVSFGFARVKKRTLVDVGDGVQIPELYGTEYYWPVEKDVYEDASIQPKVQKVVVGQVWETGDFTLVPQSSSLTTRSSATSGVLTTTYAHGLTSSDAIELFWDGGYRTATVSSTGTLTVSFSSGSGDNLPDAYSVIAVKKAAP